MNTIIETTLLEFEKSAYHLDLVKYRGGKLFIEITHTIYRNSEPGRRIQLNPNVLSDVIRVLQSYHDVIDCKLVDHYRLLTEQTKTEIRDNYFKNVPVKSIALHQNLSEEVVEQVLRNKGVMLMSTNPPKWRRRWRKKKK